MLGFQQYQNAFTAHIRDPKNNPKPAKVNNARMAVYREIVFNNLFASASACFPVCQQILGKRAWLKLVKRFFAEHQASTPIFREIPEEFLAFISTQSELPAFFAQLAHYEWAELGVNYATANLPALSAANNLLDEIPILTPAHQLLAYDYPVHKISKRFQPQSTLSTYLLVFRDVEFKVRFIELNEITFRLLQLIKSELTAGRQALAILAEELQHPDTEAVITFGLAILEDLASQHAIIGSKKMAS